MEYALQRYGITACMNPDRRQVVFVREELSEKAIITLCDTINSDAIRGKDGSGGHLRHVFGPCSRSPKLLAKQHFRPRPPAFETFFVWIAPHTYMGFEQRRCH